MSAGHERILYGANRIRAYIGDEVHWELTPHGFSQMGTDVSGELVVSNPATGDPTVSYKLWRLGSLRILCLATYDATLVNAAFATETALDANDRPAATVYEDIITVDNTTTYSGMAVLGTNGIITFHYKPDSGATWTGHANNGFKSFIMMYQVASPHSTW